MKIKENRHIVDYFQYKCEKGFYKRNLHLKQNKKEYIERLQYEVNVIIELGFVSYFLIVGDYVEWARKQKIRVGPSRGSAGGCLVSFVLGITSMDPLKYNLIFERFLNPDRVSPPDIDIDFQSTRRHEVKEYITQKHGKDCVAAIGTFGCLKAKAALSDVARSLRVQESGLNYFETAKKITKTLEMEEQDVLLEDALKRLPELQRYKSIFPQVFDYAFEIEGLIRQGGKHAGGVLISASNLVEDIPLKVVRDKETEQDMVTTEYDMITLEEMGYLKVDILGLSTLTIIEETIENIKRIRKEEIKSIPLDDQKAFEILQKGVTGFLFQVESEGMKRLLAEMKVSSIEDLSAVLAIFRPGPLGMEVDKTFAKRKNGVEAIPKQHVILDEILKSTYGLILYQEQIMKICSNLAGFTLAESDTVRRAIGKKKADLMAKQKEKFIEGCINYSGIDRKFATNLFEGIAKFAEYSFNKSHSVGYALLAYQTAYLKSHYPAEFMAAGLSNEKNDEKRILFLNECKKLGIKILPPDINKSTEHFEAIDKETIRYSFKSIKGVGPAVIETIIENAPYKCFHDFIKLPARKVNSKALAILNKAGLFLSFGLKRSQVETSIELMRSLLKKGQEIKDFEFPNLPEWDNKKTMEEEISIYGESVSISPFDLLDSRIKNREGVIKINEIKANKMLYFKGVSVIINVLVKKILVFKIKKGKNVGQEAARIFVMDNSYDNLEITVWPTQWNKFKNILNKNEVIQMGCRIENSYKGLDTVDLILLKILYPFVD